MLVVVVTLVSIVVGGPGRATAAAAASPPPGSGSAHPRVQYSPGQEPMLRARLAREPYRGLFIDEHQRAVAMNASPLGDMSIATQRSLSRAAKILAFEYALDRTVIGGVIVPFADDASRQAQGARVQELLLNLYPRDRMAVPAPLGGFDRDINTSEEIVNYATAFDTMLGTTFDFGASRATIVDLLAAVTSELHANYVDPSTANNAANLNQNNHRTKSGASMAIAAVVLADDVPAAADWFDDGVLFVDDMLRYVLVTGDGAYSEGPFYYAYTMQNLAPLMSIWDRFLGAGSWTARGIAVPSPGRSTLFQRTQRWMFDTTLPDGTMAPIDDANPGRSYDFGLLPADLPDASAGYWRWADTPQSYYDDGSVEQGPDTIVAYDDGIAPDPPRWSPTQFYVEGGTASLRSAWAKDAMMTMVLGEHDTASEFGRDRTGVGRYPESHEHADGASFMLNAFGQRLALDPGYLNFTNHAKVNKPQDHNMILVDGAGPPDYLTASFNWSTDPLGRPPAEGQATLFDTLDSPGLDATSVVTNYRNTEITRRFLQADDRYLVVADSAAGTGSSLTWMLQGNGGGTSGGTFQATTLGGRWEIGGARLDSAVAVVGQTPTLDTVLSTHEVPYGEERTHNALRATVTGGSADTLELLYPTATGTTPPAIQRTDSTGRTDLLLTDTTEDRRLTATRIGATSAGMQVVDEHLDGSLRLAYGDDITSLDHDDMHVETASPGTLGVRLGSGTASVVADTGDPTVDIAGLGFTPTTVDGACKATTANGITTVTLNRERRIELRTDGGNARPSADAGPDQRVAVGSTVVLDGSASCDAEGSSLTPSWDLVSAPAGSAWSLSDRGSFHPHLAADRPGPYRIRLKVTDAQGGVGLEREVLIIAGPRCGDGIDNDHDGLIDSDDANCDGTDPVPPTTTTSTSTTTSASTTVPPSADTTAVTPQSTAPDQPVPPSTPVVVAPLAAAVEASPRFTG
jgi:hypothetical protein